MQPHVSKSEIAYLPRGNLNGAIETISSCATSGVILRYCSWQGSVTVLTANRWQKKALVAGNFQQRN
jgi:hypothetical protein